jgi:Protein of unknown function (DUF1552)
MGKPTMTRRRFLRDLGVSVGAVPLLAGLDSLYAKAQVPTIPKKRFVVMYTPNGMLYSAWRIPVDPNTAGTAAPYVTDISDGTLLNNPSLVLQPLYENAKNLLILDRVSMIAARPVYQDLSALQKGVTNPSGGPLNTIDGLDHPGGHQKGMGSLLTGQVLIGGQQNFSYAGLSNGISVDQVIANNLFKGKVKFPSLQIAVMGTNDLYSYSDREDDKVMSYTAPSSPLVPVSNPFVLFNTIFGSGAASATSGPTIRQIMDKSVLDNSIADFTRLQSKLSSADWQLLQQHQSSIRDIENQLTAVFTLSCSAPTPPATPPGVNTADNTATLAWTELLSSYPTSGSMLINIMVQALACGLTNVVTFQWAHSEDNITYPFLSGKLGPTVPGLTSSATAGHHNMSHERDPNLVVVDQWYASQFNNIINQMAAIPDSGTSGTLLDNSLLMYTSCLSDGAAHISDNAYFTLAGSNGGYFNQGKLMRFNNVYTPLPIPAGSDPSSYFFTNEWYTTAVSQIAPKDQATVQTYNGKTIPDVSNNDLMASILDSFGLDITTAAPSMTDPRFFHGLLPGVKA